MHLGKRALASFLYKRHPASVWLPKMVEFSSFAQNSVIGKRRLWGIPYNDRAPAAKPRFPPPRNGSDENVVYFATAAKSRFLRIADFDAERSE